MLYCIAIDDEPLALQLIQSYIERLEDVELCATFTDALLAEDYLREHAIDLIFLDIQMPDISGIDFYKSLELKPAVVFTTAYSSYAVEGFNLNADDYLLKPFEFKRFELAVSRVKETLELQKQKATEEAHLVVKHNYQWIKIPFADIIYIEALDDYIKIHTAEKAYLVHMSMKAVAEKLGNDRFLRTHRSYIANTAYVNAWGKNSLQVKDISIPVSSSYQKQVLETLEKENMP
ncbi:LytR/AlgR family response regulator transcription factor [Haoranjiania flava]|uniref:LytTR family DNA-binding domain-containing protein n=1 Tax=Haoranjiania flava TaxID=1856322 RepID=A0AAE3IJQ7_9BACT|nr:LytTR family DNA-binding domain-containing protein [Haoranjiania flava]MCU7692934.1 LytTR family DNA-binding domain-containing protein [Haoranjiania flava]